MTSSDTHHKTATAGRGQPGHNGHQAATAGLALSPWPIRLLVYLMLILIALASIWLIDRRAMQRLAQWRGPSPIEANQP